MSQALAVPPQNLSQTAKLLERWAAARAETDRVFQTVKPGSLYERPIPERHRIIFYIGHLEAFDWNLFRSILNLVSFSPAFDKLFAFGIDPVDGQNPSDQPSDWPSISEVDAYVQRIRRELDRSFQHAAEHNELTYLLNIAIEHRLMHAETLEYMLHQLPLASKSALSAAISARYSESKLRPEMVAIEGGIVSLGSDSADGEFGWDNEFEPCSVVVPSFSIDKFKVTNGEFREFYQSGGYQTRGFWTDADWEWRQAENITHPAFWKPAAGGFVYRSMFAEIPLPLNAPVFVSHAEANAYARWAGKDLPSEPQWQRAAEGAGVPEETRALFDPPPVTYQLATASRFGVEGLIGTGWEWTSSPFAPFPGFLASTFYPGYSANFFDDKHYVLKGGSTRTDSCMLRKSFRNWFQPHYQYVYAGFRCVRKVKKCSPNRY